MDNLDDVTTTWDSRISARDVIQDGPTAEALSAMQRAGRWLAARQQEDGHWCGELEGDSILESEYLLLLAWLGEHRGETARKCAAYLERTQRAAGGWSMYPGGPLEISGSVKAYFALKLAGADADSEPMRRARDAIRAAGGADAVNSFTRFYLALLGQIDYRHCPAVPPEMVLLPRWFPVNLSRISAWSRTIFVPLSIMWAHRPVRQLPAELGIRELFVREPDEWPALRAPGLKASSGRWSWEQFFRRVDATFKWCERYGIRPLRRRALRRAERWMLDRSQDSDGLGAIFPPIIWSIVALKCLGYADDSPEVRDCHAQLAKLMIDDGQTIRLQPCLSPVWDTAIASRALAAAGMAPTHPVLRRSTEWLLDREVRVRGDWADNVDNSNGIEPSGWCFEYRNPFYPDVDDTIMVLMALGDQWDGPCRESTGSSDSRRGTWRGARWLTAAPDRRDTKQGWLQHDRMPREAVRQSLQQMDASAQACERGLNWTLAMQNRDGGWGAFDRGNDLEFLCHVPFADHNAMIDPSTPDITGRVLEMLGKFGWQRSDEPVRRAIDYLRRTQESDGAWPGRWGVNYIYGTWQVLVGLAAVGLGRHDPALVRGAQWLIDHQHADGGWGESPATYDNPALRGQGDSTASQTAWAVLGLTAAGLRRHAATLRGVHWLASRQTSSGMWDEPQFTGTGFPRVFYLRYHLYPAYFPLLALATWHGGAEALTP